MRIANAKKYLIILVLEALLAGTLWWANPAGGRVLAPRNPCLANVVIARGQDGASHVSGHLMVFAAGSQWIFNVNWKSDGALHVLHRQIDARFQDLGRGRFQYLTRNVSRYRDDTGDDLSTLFPMLQPGMTGSMTFTPVADGLYNVQVNEDFQFYCSEQ
ncbi:MAG: hypothetical protein JO171_03210 [Paludibacterium sp.]|uniref:hypothetical protein n=1 Tax=Paludibacterium sp. TaxID=1917523 RepID=UPI0025E84B63|nr:hypothetical protein [Paludibacterium sp.]MBV8046133.1 hypothetical protein [Paludibacterium sp.]MBV8648801.1 hypothetical protein [Paludibacterium sp.]